MKCINKKVLAKKSEIMYERAQQREQEYLDSLTPEERQEYEARKRKRQHDAVVKLAQLQSIAHAVGGPYTGIGYHDPKS